MTKKKSVSVSLEGVSKIFKNTQSRRGQAARPDIVAVRDANFTVKPGDLVTLLGPSGCGKTTTLRMVAGFDLGAIRRKDVPYLRRKLGIVFQDYQLLMDRSVADNLLFVLRATGWRERGAMVAKAREVLEKVGLRNKEYKMPFELSGGEQQRLAIARALLNDPVVILADEPTGNLDPEAGDEIMRLFQGIAADGCAIVMSTHNVANIQLCPSRTVRFDRGCIEELDIGVIFG